MFSLQVVLLVRKATGDEEVSAARGQLRGVILAQSLPHLSHLGAGAVPLRMKHCAIRVRRGWAVHVITQYVI